MTLGIVGNFSNPNVVRSVRDICEKLLNSDVNFYIDDNFKEKLNSVNSCYFDGKYLDDKSIIDRSDYILSFGGDGTMLWSAKLTGNSGKPILGINLGKLGFLTEYSTDNVFNFIEDIKNKNYIIEERTVIDAYVPSLDKNLYGLNEIVIGKEGHVKTIEIHLTYEEENVIVYNSDGLIVSTPTGSTGYSLSAGGPIMYPDCKTFIITPICPHSLTARPIIIPDGGVITATVNSRVPVIITADGNEEIRLEKHAKIIIKKADYTIKLLRKKDSYYFEIVNKKLLLGEDIRQKIYKEINKS